MNKIRPIIILMLFVPFLLPLTAFASPEEYVQSQQDVYTSDYYVAFDGMDFVIYDRSGNVTHDFDGCFLYFDGSSLSNPNAAPQIEIFDVSIRDGRCIGVIYSDVYTEIELYFKIIGNDNVIYHLQEPFISEIGPSDYINLEFNDVAQHQYFLRGPEDQWNDWEVSVRTFGIPQEDIDMDIYIGNIVQSNPNANIQIDPIIHLEDGKGIFSIYSDQPTDISLQDFEVISHNSLLDNYKWNLNVQQIYGHDDPEGTVGFEIYRVGPETIKMYIHGKSMQVDSEWVMIDAAPYIKNSRTYVPIRALAEGFGANVDWDGSTGTVTIDMAGNNVSMAIGSSHYRVNGISHVMDAMPEVTSEGRTCVPVRFVAEALGFHVSPQYSWNGTTISVTFRYQS